MHKEARIYMQKTPTSRIMGPLEKEVDLSRPYTEERKKKEDAYPGRSYNKIY